MNRVHLKLIVSSLSILLLLCCESKIHLTEFINESGFENRKFVIVLSPDTRCPGCYGLGFQLGQAFYEESVIITTAELASQYDSDNIIMAEREKILGYIPKHFMSMVISLDGSFKPIRIIPGNGHETAEKLHTLFSKPGSSFRL